MTAQKGALPVTWRNLIAICGLCASAAACSSIEVKTQYDAKVDFSRYRTFDWVPKPTTTGPLAHVAPEYRARLEHAVEVALDAKGLHKAPSNVAPDLQLDYHVRLRIDQDTWVSNWGWPYLPTSQADWGYAYSNLPGPAVEVRDYEVGTLVMDIVDTKERRLVWRGSATGAADPSATQSMLVSEAQRVLASYPPRS
jgi:hypothetical protein